MATHTPIERCLRAMSYTYGDFDGLSDEECKSWIPPPVPGTGDPSSRRLWTDSFGVLNLISLFLESNQGRYLILAERLARTVHEVLGRTRDGAHRLPGATEGRPLLGGLRSGRTPEKDDGQVYRELVMWMFALDRLGRAAGDARWEVLAVELGEAIHPRFTVHKLSGGMRLVGRVSCDMEDVLDVEGEEGDAEMGWAVFRIVREGTKRMVLGREVDELERVIGSEQQQQQQRMQKRRGGEGMSIWVGSLWKGSEIGRQGVERVGGVFEGLFEGVRQTLDEAASGVGLERRVEKEVGGCLGVRCWVGEGKMERRVEREMVEVTERVVRLWEERLEMGEVRGVGRGVVGVVVAGAVLPRAFRRDGLMVKKEASGTSCIDG
ncbi:hypothetical protein NLU13_0080 [Sarocladium strictum]|uniref:Uncharacterized protein n=1 Tax=Sarocladium strictum TaxID=5046 RepID=A0AA39GNQ1_SARSR|nr:hypothetical protein NLU13_0080 [Sarocladium strictum]